MILWKFVTTVLESSFLSLTDLHVGLIFSPGLPDKDFSLLAVKFPEHGPDRWTDIIASSE